jgi:2-dehydro-3-deoxy-D-arabinonate dehydratase
MPNPDKVTISMVIERNGLNVFEGSSRLSAMARSFEDLVTWLGRETSFPNGVILLTGTGIVPPDDFFLTVEDHIAIQITGIGRLTNWVAHRGQEDV